MSETARGQWLAKAGTAVAADACKAYQRTRATGKPAATYELVIPGLAEAIAGAVPSPRHTQLLSAIRAHEPLSLARLATTREGSSWAGRKVLTAAGELVHEDHRAWLQIELARDAGHAATTRARLQPLGYLLTHCALSALYIVHDAGGADQAGFVQLVVLVEDECIDRVLFDPHNWLTPRDHADLCSLTDSASALQGEARKCYRPTAYRLHQAVDVGLFVQQAEALERAKRAGYQDRRFELIDAQTGEREIRTYAQMNPGYDRFPPKARRFFDDWAASSAGRSGAHVSGSWVMQTSDHTGPGGERSMSLVPMWTFTGKLAKIDATRTAYALKALLAYANGGMITVSMT